MKDFLLISYNFPPYWSPGTVRVGKLTKYLPEFGWRPLVITARRSHIPENLRTPMDDFLKARIIRLPCNPLDWMDSMKLVLKAMIPARRQPLPRQPSGRVEKGLPQFRQIYRLGLGAKLSRWMFPIDTYVVWAPFAFLTALWTLWRRPDIRLILVSGPPFSQVCVGALLRRLFPSRTFIADFRDTWIEDYNRYYPTAFHRALESAAERFVAKAADALTVVADDFVPLFEKKYALGSRLHLLHNGFDEDDFRDLEAAPYAKAGPFTLNYFGGIGEGRNIAGLLRAIQKLKNEGSITEDSFQANFHGSVHAYFRDEVQSLGLEGLVKFMPRMPYRVALTQMASSSALLLVFENDPNGGFFSTKVFEYLYVRRPVLVIGPARGAGKFIETHHIGRCVAEDNVEGIARAILELQQRHRSEGLPNHAADIQAFSRRRIAGEMAKIFDSLVTPA